MTDKELYKRTFSRLHTDHALRLEVMGMKKNTKGIRCKRSFIIVTAILLLIFAMTCVSYAATDGQILNDIKLWINGQQYDASSYMSESGHYIIEVQGKTDVLISGEKSEISVQSGSEDSGDAVLDIYEEMSESEPQVTAELKVGSAQ